MTTTRVLLDVQDASDHLSPANRIVELELPEGYYRVWEGALKPGDLFLNRLAALDGITEWEPVIRFPTERQARTHKPWSSAAWYECVIRKGTPVAQACDRCGVAARAIRLRYCGLCALIVAGRD